SVRIVRVHVHDASDPTVQGAKLIIQDLPTNKLRSGETMGGGTATFASVPLGNYKLTITKTGFQSEVLSSVVVQGGRVTDLKVQLKVGAEAETVVVSATEVPLVELTSSAIATTIDMKQIEDLPLGGRDISSLARLSPGFSGTGGSGTWN